MLGMFTASHIVLEYIARVSRFIKVFDHLRPFNLVLIDDGVSGD